MAQQDADEPEAGDDDDNYPDNLSKRRRQRYDAQHIEDQRHDDRGNEYGYKKVNHFVKLQVRGGGRL